MIHNRFDVFPCLVPVFALASVGFALAFVGFAFALVGFAFAFVGFAFVGFAFVVAGFFPGLVDDRRDVGFAGTTSAAGSARGFATRRVPVAFFGAA